ncbi:ATP-binding cassette, sub-family C [Blastocystis sp. ATCC 50177/Nand II]|uniref:ATP-binding cassette, sub-family C n=1 Tax=Blastocystis sp. subtype 1 (strain ATCC 50177 / NandII) TaxID=478820 RepID=A0A196SHW6_BLAHN|nr:ATP-binding cassette, sub-family C [Blastocystis sp. ATCC 50177/Nand II]
MAIIPQEPLLFSGTARDNLDPFKQYTDKEIWSSLERARMWQTVAENPAGLEAVVEKHGSNFSVGQRQLLCVARALLRKSKVILMDEATASIDVETDLTIQKTIRSEFKDSTVITIAHRIHTISDSDKVLVLDLGEVKEFDAPGVLLSDKNSLYSQLVEKSKEVE